MVKAKRVPQPVKLSERITAWRYEEIKELIDNPGSFSGNREVNHG
jgi:predicted DNA-binding transcriptional regulator AlpA